MKHITYAIGGLMPTPWSKTSNPLGQYLYVPFVPPIQATLLPDSLYHNPLPAHLLDLRRRIAIPCQNPVEI